LIGSLGEFMDEMNDDYGIENASPDEVISRIVFEISYQEVFLNLLLKKLEEKGILKTEEFKNEVQREIEQNYGFYVEKYYANR
jgi:hypothetical protein